ncbi:MAG: hypothetical protein WA667_23620 [Candidatus Nitrosopolaris sp.]
MVTRLLLDVTKHLFLKQIRSRFDTYSTLFPDDVINSENELIELLNEIQFQFDKDLGGMRKLLISTE